DGGRSFSDLKTARTRFTTRVSSTLGKITLSFAIVVLRVRDPTWFVSHHIMLSQFHFSALSYLKQAKGRHYITHVNLPLVDRRVICLPNDRRPTVYSATTMTIAEDPHRFLNIDLYESHISYVQTRQ